jgi:hypothetical protein
LLSYFNIRGAAGTTEGDSIGTKTAAIAHRGVFDAESSRASHGPKAAFNGKNGVMVVETDVRLSR